MKGKMKRLLAIALSVMMTVSMISTDLLAATNSQPVGGPPLTTNQNTSNQEPTGDPSNISNSGDSTNVTIESFTFRVEQKMLIIGDTVSVVPVINGEEKLPENSKGIRWSSSDETVATIKAADDGTATIEAVGEGPATIIGISNDDEDFVYSVSVTVRKAGVNSVTIRGNVADYYVGSGNIISLEAELDYEVPEASYNEDYKVKWTSANERVATVDANGRVTTVGQGRTVIRAEVDGLGIYDEIEIQVYDSAPQKATIQIWVTNQKQGQSVEVFVPSNGASVNVADLLPKTYAGTNGKNYIFTTGIVRYTNRGSDSAWAAIQNDPIVSELQYVNRQLQYKTENGNWTAVRNGYQLAAFYGLQQSVGTDADISITVGDWPYGENEGKDHTNKTIRVWLVDENSEIIHRSGLMRYDNGQTSASIGKIDFGYDDTRYEIKKVNVYRVSQGTGLPNSAGVGDISENGRYYLETASSLDKVPSEGISVSFAGTSSTDQRHYVVVAQVVKKSFTVSYTAESGVTGTVPETRNYKVDEEVTVETGQNLQKAGYVFGGWNYTDNNEITRRYYGGNKFNMPTYHVQLEAFWLPVVSVIKYQAENGKVDNRRDICNPTSGELNGATATPAEPEVYEFKGWFEEGSNVAVSHDLTFKPTGNQIKTTTYTAKFEPKEFRYTVYYYEKGTSNEISSPETKTAPYKSKISADSEKIDITGYVYDSAAPAELTIGINSGENIINLYYESLADELRYDSNGGQGEEIDPTKGYIGSTVNVTSEEPKREGYTLAGWNTAKDGNGTVYEAGDLYTLTENDDILYAQWTANPDTRYTVEYYYQENGAYPAAATNSAPRHDATDAEVKVTEADMKPAKGGYVYDADAANVLEGTVAGNGSTVLKVYFKQQFKVTYAPGTYGTFAQQETDGLDYGAETPAAPEGEALTHEEGYTFNGWSPVVEASVTANVTYEAQWTERNDLSYKVLYYYDDETATSPEVVAKYKEAVFGTAIDYVHAKSVTHNEKTYVLKEVKFTNDDPATQGFVTVDDAKNVIEVYYELDQSGPNQKPDGIPDSKEYTITYTGNGGINKLGEAQFKDPGIYPEGYEITTAPGDQFTKKNEKQTAVFGHWKNMANGHTYDPNALSFQMPADNVVLTAQWMMLDVNKTAVNANRSYNRNEDIEFTIAVKNIGDEGLKDILVEDELQGRSGDVKITSGTGYSVKTDANNKTTAQIGTLPVGEEVFVNATYKVTVDDITAGTVVNTAKATSEGGATAKDEADAVVMAGKDYQLLVNKSIKQVNGQYVGATGLKNGKPVFTAGDTITFEIKVTNKGNQILHNVVVEDILEGAQITNLLSGYRVEGGKAVIDSLEPDKDVTIEATYIVKESDLGNTAFENVATAKADETENPTSGTETIPVEDKRPEFTVSKELLNQKDIYEIGDRIEYKISVNNTGNIDLKNIVVTDLLANATGQVTFVEQDGVTIEGNVATIAVLPKTQNITLECSYEVMRADAGAAISNTASATGSAREEGSPDPTPVTDSTEAVNVERDYQLTIHYVYADGTTAVADVVVRYLAGETFSYDSPAIAGYTPDLAFVRSDANGMPKQDVEVTVIYTAVPGTPTPTPTTPTPPTTPPTPPVTVVPTPDGPATIPAPVLIGEEEVPLGGEVTVDDDGNVTVVPVEDEEVPLARDIDDHDCCALHFLLTLAAFIIYLFFTKSMKKRQAKINELRDQYETEVLKRKLGIADNDKDRTV